MITLVKREINVFLNSITGYVVIAVFLVLLSLFLWVFKQSSFNILENGYAGLTPFFQITPWIYLFLIPAITMRSFAEEKRTGTIELLMTRPLSDMKIIVAKSLGCFALVVISLLPTIIYIASVNLLGSPTGNADIGAIFTAYIGLLLLGSAYISIGIFSSSITDNQIVAFLMSVLLCFFFLVGFEYIGTYDLLGNLDYMILSLGLRQHYDSIGRGVLDSRDVIYFFSFILLFLSLTHLVVQRRRW